MLFGNGPGHIPRKAKVESESRRNAPIVLDEGTVNLPAAASDGAVVGLVVFAQSGHPHQQVRFGIAGNDYAVCSVGGAGIARGSGTVCGAGSTFVAAEVSEEGDDPEAILECFCADIHLIGAEIDAGVNLVLAADQIEIVLEREDIRSALKWGVAAIAERPITALNNGGRYALTV